MCPDITHGKGPDAFDIVSYNVGFRPARRGGIRIEKEIKRTCTILFTNYLPINISIDRSNGQKVTVCHNYGHGSHGKNIASVRNMN